MPTPRDPGDTLSRGGWNGKATLVNPGKLQQPTPNNYGQPVKTGNYVGNANFEHARDAGFPMARAGNPMGTTAPLRKWVKIGHLSQGQGGAQKVTPGILGPRAGFR